MKISAMVLVGKNEPYLEYCLKSIEPLVDEIICMGLKEAVLNIYSKKVKKIRQKGFAVDFAKWRNQVLDKSNGQYILWMDADEVIAKNDGSPVSRKELESIIKSNPNIDNFIFPTLHFMYNFFTLDGRNNGNHWCMRLFKNDGRRFKRKVHEFIDMKEEKTIRVGDALIWHFGHCKGIQELIGRYKERHIKDNPYTGDMSVNDFNEYLKTHNIIRGRIPLMAYHGPLPKIMGLW